MAGWSRPSLSSTARLWPRLHYVGGKSKLAKTIAQMVRHHAHEQGFRAYLEPFCGGLSVTSAVQGIARTACDNHAPLISLYRAVQLGWRPPEQVTREQYDSLKASDQDTPLRTFVGYAGSFRGIWWGGYFKGTALRSASRSLVRKIKACRDVRFAHSHFDRHEPVRAVVYCDPPYAGVVTVRRQVYPGIEGTWEAAPFWAAARRWSEAGNVVLVSEYHAPEDFKCVWSGHVPVGLGSNDTDAREALYLHERWAS